MRISLADTCGICGCNLYEREPHTPECNIAEVCASGDHSSCTPRDPGWSDPERHRGLNIIIERLPGYPSDWNDETSNRVGREGE